LRISRHFAQEKVHAEENPDGSRKRNAEITRDFLTGLADYGGIVGWEMT
jgi:hypothetical protein